MTGKLNAMYWRKIVNFQILNFTKILRANNTNDNKKIIKDFISTYMDNQDLPTKVPNLVVSQPRTPRSYMFPKIHTIGNHGRPIDSAYRCPIELFSISLHNMFIPTVENLPKYVKDSTHVLNILEPLQPVRSGGNEIVNGTVLCLSVWWLP